MGEAHAPYVSTLQDMPSGSKSPSFLPHASPGRVRRNVTVGADDIVERSAAWRVVRPSVDLALLGLALAPSLLRDSGDASRDRPSLRVRLAGALRRSSRE